MKRLVVGLLLAATAYVPLAAGAQRREGSLQAADNVDRAERRAERQERRAVRLEAGGTVQAPAVDRVRRDRDGDGQPDRRRDRAEIARPDSVPDPVIGRAPRPDRDQRPIRRADRADLADYGTDPQGLRAERRDDRRDLRRDRLGVDSRFRTERGLDRRFDGRQGFDGRSADLYRGGQVWNRGWRNDDRYDWNRARLRNRNAYRLPRYYAPQGAGYGYRRFGVGFQLSRSLFARDYWLDDPFAYRLPPAYGPYRWVRYHGDALLVDLRTGRVIDVVYDIFY